MKYLALLAFIAFVIEANAQDYLISFTGSGAATTVSSVKVENLTQGTSLEMSGTNVLHLVNSITGIKEVINSDDWGITFSPNPMSEFTRMQFYLPEDGDLYLALYDITGRCMYQGEDHLSKGLQIYNIKGVANGLHVITVRAKSYSATGRFMGNTKGSGRIRIEYESTTSEQLKDNTSETKGLFCSEKGINEERLMQYNEGDRLLYTGTTNIYSTVVTDVPTESKTITFEFIACTDGDNNYPIVQIGNQVWMAENLKTTKYNDGPSIPNLIDNLQWYNAEEGAYCWYNNNVSNKDNYGALYNWYTVNTGKLCPGGWHVPSSEEWTILTNYLGGSGVAGGKLKETGTVHWYPQHLATDNSSGFTAVGGGCRSYSDGTFVALKNFGYWWSATETDLSNAGFFGLAASYINVYTGQRIKKMGYSVRCLKD